MKKKEDVLQFLKEDRIKLGTVSGIFTTKLNLVRWVDQNIPTVELITTKSYQVKHNPGNREPIIVEQDVGNYGNAVGLKNPGMDEGYRELKKLRDEHPFRCVLNVSLSASSISDFIVLVKKFEDIADILELNFSCPHAKEGFGSSIGSSSEIVEEYVREIRKHTSALLFPKLTPNVENIGEIARAAMNGGADGISAINTVGPQCFHEPHTEKPILYNPKGHKGGRSGEWIKQIALQKIREIRKAVGEVVPIIGMGGVSSGSDVMLMREAGADVIGVGSVFARVATQDRPEYLSALKEDAQQGTDRSQRFLSQKRTAEYKPYQITNIKQIGDDLRIIELTGRMNYQSSQFAFLWIPGVGEKPFSIAKNEPLTFIIRKRGKFTKAIFSLNEGERLMVRGVYGVSVPISEKPKAYIIAGGTGIAVAPKLAQKLQQEGKEVAVYYGITSKEQAVFKEEIERSAEYIPVVDKEGRKGEVLSRLKENLLEKNLSHSCFYNIGPVPLMARAIDIQRSLGADMENIFASIETNNMCGMGMCGECECGGRLTCQQGTFFSLAEMRKKGINLHTMDSGNTCMIIKGKFVHPDGVKWLQVKVNKETGLIEEVSENLGKAEHSYDDNHLIFPGFIDLHVHAREDFSGEHNYKEDFVSAAQAALNGGVVAIAEMPNNKIPVIDDESYFAKRKLTQKSEIPVLLYAGIGPDTKPLSFAVPYKVFMGPSVGELFFSSNEQLERTMANYQGCEVSFHCECPEILEENKDKATHEEQRPAQAEIEAIRFALVLTEKYNLKTKICHLSTAEGLRLCNEAKKKGLSVTVEVTPHHLYFDKTMLTEQNKKLLQMNPPLRTSEDRKALLEGLQRGEIDYLATDHAPHLPDEKEKGISGVPHLDTYALFVSWLIKAGGISPERITQVCCHNPGRFLNRFLGTKFGEIKEGYEGKFTVLDLSGMTAVSKEFLKTKCRWSVFEGISFPGRVDSSI